MRKLKSMTELRYNLSTEFRDSFFSKETKKFFGDCGYKWSSKNQVLTITRIRNGVTSLVEYEPSEENGELVLRLKKVEV